MMSPETFILAARNYSAGLTQGAAAKEYLEGLPKLCENLGRSVAWSTLDNMVSQLISGSPDEQCVFGALGVLFAKTKSPDFPTQLEHFLIQFANVVEGNGTDPQVLRVCAPLVSGTCDAIVDQMIRRRNPILAINLMRSIIDRLQKNPRQLTGVHASLLQLCLAAGTLKPALPFLLDDVDDFTSDMKGADCKNVLLYFYYGGMILAGLKMWDKAIYFFEAATRVPAQTLSHIMLEAYKKYILVCLIALGHVPAPHKSATQVVNRILKPSCQQYIDLANAFGTHNPNEVNNVVSRQQEVFRRDNNMGLVKQVKVAQTKLNIQRLTKTFLTLSLSDVGARVQLGTAEEAEKVILSMIQDGEICAKINQMDGMVIFLDHKEQYDSPKMLEKIETQIGSCIELNKRLQEMNEKLSTNPEFISKVVLSSGGGGLGGGAGNMLNMDEQDMSVTAVASSSSSGASTSKLPSFIH